LYKFRNHLTVALHLLERLVPLRPAGDPQVLVEQGPMEALDEAVALRPADRRRAVLDLFELQEQFVRVPIRSPAELPAVVRDPPHEVSKTLGNAGKTVYCRRFG
jgi:hypothetical protein